jgi:integrase
MARNRNDGLRKVCSCAPSAWTKCPHGWRINFKWKGVHHRYALDRLLAPKKVRSKTEAEGEAEKIRTAIREGTFRDPQDPEPAPVLSTLTLAQLLDTYDKRYLTNERPNSVKKERYQITAIGRIELPLLNGTVRRFGDWFVSDITTDTIEQFRAARRQTGAIVTTNRNLALLRACFNWGIRVGYVERTPFKRGTETVVKLSRELRRSRRLEPGEDERLLTACRSPHLRALVEAALETGCRQGELLSLQWHQVRSQPRAELFLPAQKTKTKRDRRIPISTRLAAILAMRRAGPDGKEHPPDAYVFGNEVGEPIKRVSRGWEAAVLRAHGQKPTYEGKNKRLTVECRGLLRGINLHFHDLRREAGSRWLDGGVPLQIIRDWLGHANISQTSTYLEATFAGQHEAMRAFEAKRGVQQSATPSETSGQNLPPDDTTAHTEARKH